MPAFEREPGGLGAQARARRNSQLLQKLFAPGSPLSVGEDGAVFFNVLTTKGDILGYSTAVVRVPVGSNGQYLVADSAVARGIKWAAIPDATTLIKGLVKQSVANVDSGSSTVTLTAAVDPANTPITADALRDDLVANTLPSLVARDTELETAIEALAATVNSLQAKLRTAGTLA